MRAILAEAAEIKRQSALGKRWYELDVEVSELRNGFVAALEKPNS